MSKSKKKIKKSTQNSLVKKRSKSKIIVAAAVIAAAVCAVAALCVRAGLDNARASKLTDVVWKPVSANNASGDSVELADIYNVKYSNYSGELLFEKDGKFSLWVRPETDEGNHSGTYELLDNTVELSFEDGSSQSLELERDTRGNINSVKVVFEGYDIYFTPAQTR